MNDPMDKGGLLVWLLLFVGVIIFAGNDGNNPAMYLFIAMWFYIVLGNLTISLGRAKGPTRNFMDPRDLIQP